MIQKKALALVLVLMFVLSACGQQPTATEAPPATTNTPVATNTPAPTATPVDTPTATPIPPTPTPEVQQFFTETFQNDYEKNWSYFLREGKEKFFALTVESEGLLFDLRGFTIFAYLFYKPFEYEEVRVEAVVENRGINANNITLFCMYSPEGGWYEFNISSSGLYNILFTKPDKGGNQNYGLIADGGSKKVKMGNAINTYAIACKKDSLTLFINGDEVRSVGIPKYVLENGKVGISVSSFWQHPVQVLFRQVTISKP